MKIRFELERETKNTVRYQEEAPEGEHSIGTLYVQKRTLRRLAQEARVAGYPQTLEVSIDVLEG